MKSIHGPLVCVATAILVISLWPATAAAEVECRRVAPKATDAAIDECLQDHVVCIDPAAAKRNRLFVYLPGTRALAHRYTMLTQEAARSGLHAISLRYVNNFAVNFEVCPYMNDVDCYEDVRKEIIYAEDALESLEITRANSVVNRLVKLLLYLDEQHPGEGWRQYVGPDGEPDWSSIVISGHSQGAGHATMIARDNRVARLIVFAWADVAAGGLAPWIAPPFATPPEDCYAFEHVRDRGVQVRRMMWKELGMSALQPEVNVDTAEPQYRHSRTLSTNIEPVKDKDYAGPHNSVAVDDFTPLADDGTPVMQPVWRYLLDVPPAERSISHASGDIYKLARGTHRVGLVPEITLHDADRDREIPLRITYPRGEGRYPVIVFGHGAVYAGANKDLYEPLVEHWVSHGYVVLQAGHPDAATREQANARQAGLDFAERPRDVSFLIDSLDEIAREAPELAGRMDPARVGAGGHYMGAGQSGLIAGAKIYASDESEPTTFTDDRVRAAVLLSPTGLSGGMHEDSWADITIPMLVMTGSNDISQRTGNPAEWRTHPFRYSSPPNKFLLWVEGLNWTYGGLYGPNGPDYSDRELNSDFLIYTRTVTLAFWDAYLKGDAGAEAYLKSGRLEKATRGEAKLEFK
jgi:dienelactone hydrolase